MNTNTIRKIVRSEYPLQLQKARSIPDYLYIRGEMPGPEYTFLCVVGSRKYSTYGKNVCAKLVSGLKGYPIVIVSGLAIGIDGMSHEATLKAGLRTIAFPGSGLDPHVIYPPINRNLAERILGAGGALISPFQPSQQSTPWTFPRRNQIMAGISHAVLVIEGGHTSGTLLTTKEAADNGRDILAVPGSIFGELSYGPHTLIRDGAALVSSPDDILRALGFSVPADNEPRPFKNLAELSLCPEEKMLVAELQLSPQTDSSLIRRTSLTPSLFNIFISGLELKNVVVQENGKYRLNH